MKQAQEKQTKKSPLRAKKEGEGEEGKGERHTQYDPKKDRAALLAPSSTKEKDEEKADKQSPECRP